MPVVSEANPTGIEGAESPRPASGSSGSLPGQAGWPALIDRITCLPWKALWLALVGGVILLGAALRFHALGSKSLWGDEIYQATWARQSLLWIYNFRLPYIEAALDIYITHFARLLGETEFVLRFPAALFGILSLALIYQLGRRLFQPLTGLLAALLLALSAFHVAYSQEVRTYALFVVLTILSLDRFMVVLRRPARRERTSTLRDRGPWVAWVLATLLSFYAHFFTVFVFAAEMATALILAVTHRWWQSRRRHLGWILLGGLLIFLLWLPEIVPALPDLFGRATSQGSPITAGPNTSMVTRLLVDLSAVVKDLVLQFSGSPRTVPIFIALLLAGSVAAWLARRRQSLLLCLMVLVLPLATAPFRSSAELFFARYFIFMLPVFLVLVAHGAVEAGGLLCRLLELLVGKRVRMRWPAGLARLWGRISHYSPARILATAMTLALVALICAESVAPLQAYYHSEKDDWRDAAAIVQANLQAGDVVASLKWAAPNLRFYAPNLPIRKLVDETPAELDRLFAESPRLWYVRGAGHAHATPDLEAWIRDHGFFTVQLPGLFISLGSRGTAISQAQKDRLLQSVSLRTTARSPLEQGDLYMERGLAKEAVVEYLRAVAQNPSWGMARTKLGNAYLALGQQAKAEASYRRSIEVEPSYLGAYIRLGGIYQSQGKLQEALALYQKAVEIDPSSAWAQSALGTAYIKLGNTEEGLARLKRAVELEPQNVEWLLALADAYRELGRPSDAVVVYQQVLALDPNNHRATSALQALKP